LSGTRHTTLRLAAALGGVALLLGLAVVAGTQLALELAPALLLLGLVAVGWMPGEDRLVRAIRRRRPARRRGPAPIVRLRGPRRQGGGGRTLVGVRTTRGPPAPLAV
jgi:hypothetical protein